MDDKELWKQAYRDKVHADRFWDKVFSEMLVEHFHHAVEMCNKTENKLMDIEARIRVIRTEVNQK